MDTTIDVDEIKQIHQNLVKKGAMKEMEKRILKKVEQDLYKKLKTDILNEIKKSRKN